MGVRGRVGDDAPGDESFAPTSGTFVGWLLIAVAAVVAAMGVRDGWDGFGPAAVVAALVASVFSWLVLLRPRVLIQGGDVVLRQSLTTTRIPLASVEEVSVRHVMEIRADGRRHQTAAVGHPRRRIMREAAQAGRRDQQATPPRIGEVHWADHVEAKVRRAALDARARTTGESDREAVRHVDVVPTAAAAVVVVLALVVFLL
ncbi:hypothetical protein [Nocardioides daphniae]|uniref:PH domain-containing protein n=1 Tax=Nocardioides daphniae TaxID=402297 RepID=A0A4P7UGR5_9ACTN|nr:hypothetical protein [Nocardioides daphniae]QCC77899.1 hypothetical protein E2C04_13180 [Nocardioides daphniae]GGD27300.1 hypothetical protein GCM10007231_28410 [Nocardioides daphniae]